MRSFMLVVLCVLCLSQPSFAQETPAFDVSGGYSFLRDQEVEQNFHGWFASAAGYFNPWFGIAADLGGNYRTLQVLGTDVDLSIHSFLVGPRFSIRRAENATPFVQVLVGAARASGGVLGFTESATEFALQTGVGADFWLARNFGVRMGGEYRRMAMSDGTNEFRFTAGVVVSGGSR